MIAIDQFARDLASQVFELGHTGQHQNKVHVHRLH